LSTPGIDQLYSGVANRTASAPAIASRSAATLDVVVLVVRWDGLEAVPTLELNVWEQL
jgi:hypothetical protein